MARRMLPFLLLLALAGLPGAAHADTSCASGLASPAIGTVTRTTCDSAALNGVTHLSYYVPEDCVTNGPCPVLYLLHGFGQDDREMLGTTAQPSSYVAALTDGAPLDFILVSPEGRTPASTCAGKSPPAGQESFWVDWNPLYWGPGCAPKFEEHVTKELVALADKSFPTIAARDGRAIAGVSLGGFGAFKLAFQHPDLYANAGSVSGALNILVAPDVQPIGPGIPGTGGFPIDAPTYQHLPRVITTPPGFPFGDPFGAFGDPAADETYFRGNNPLDLAVNSRAVGCSSINQSFCLPMRFFSNNTVPDTQDVQSPPAYASQQALEDAVLPMNTEMRGALTELGVPFTYELHPGLHSAKYWDPFLRAQLEWMYERVSHPGQTLTLSAPSTFDFRSIRDHFSVWGWSVDATHRAQEFVTLWGASRDGVTVTGSGSVTLTTPDLDITGVNIEGAYGATAISNINGVVTMTFAIAPQGPTDEHAGASGVPGGSGTVKITFVHA